MRVKASSTEYVTIQKDCLMGRAIGTSSSLKPFQDPELMMTIAHVMVLCPSMCSIRLLDCLGLSNRLLPLGDQGFPDEPEKPG